MIWPIRIPGTHLNIDGYRPYLDPYGFSSAYYNFGGYLSNRPLVQPLPYPSITSMIDMYTDIQRAVAVGIDAFLLNFWYGPETPAGNRN